MILRYALFFVLFGGILGSSHYYVWARLVRDAGWPAPWSKLGTVVVTALFVLLMSSFIVGRVLPRAVSSPLMWVTYSWLGVLFFLMMALGLADLVRVVAVRSPPDAPLDPDRRLMVSRIFGGAAALSGLGAAAAGTASALSPVAVSRVKVTIDKLSKAASGMRIVQISDVHIGPTIGKDFIESVVARINALDADVVAITGDLVDGKVEALAEHAAPLAKLKARHGVYFVTGNHEYYSGAEEWIAHLRDLGIRVLRNEHVRIGGDGGFDLAGIDDASSHGLVPGHGSDLRRALDGRDAARACVLLAHQPRGIDLAEKLGVDLQLSGHTHGGQIFPWGIFVRLQQPFVEGLHRLERAQIYVSRGTGYWGPPMRLGAPAEITEIELVGPVSS